MKELCKKNLSSYIQCVQLYIVRTVHIHILYVEWGDGGGFDWFFILYLGTQ
jgi:hypothetical protein